MMMLKEQQDVLKRFEESLSDVAEVEIIERAIREYEINHRLDTF